jgi:S1-C subfamily serine protease
MLACLVTVLMCCKAPATKPALADPLCPGYIGITFVEVGRGVRVDSIYPQSPASEAELQPNDVIVSLGGMQARQTAEFQRFIFNTPPRTVLAMVIERNGKEIQGTIRIGYRPADFPHRIIQDSDDEP